ncbi:MAG: hypothetical protein R2834_02505 [Rhodothermales bacterium]
MPPSSDSPQIVVLVHGIRTQAPWAEMVMHCLEDEPTVQKVIPVRYGYFNMFRFLTPVLTRRGPIQQLARELRDIRKQYPDARLSLIAHSFGTYATAQVLDNETDIEIDRLILCGSIIPQDFRWDKVADRVHHEILNDCGTRDIWPVMAKFMTWGFGPSGTFGFGKSRVRDRFHNFRHSDFFNRDFVETYWSPYIAAGEIKHSDWELHRPTPPWWQSLLGIVKLPILLVLLLAATVGWRAVRNEAADRNARAVCVAPGRLLWEKLPPVDGAVAAPFRLRIEIRDRVVSVDTMRQRIYCIGTDAERTRRIVNRTPAEERYSRLRGYFGGLTSDASTVERLVERTTSPETGFVTARRLEAGDAVRIEVMPTASAEPAAVYSLTTTVGDRPYTLEIIE